MTTAVDDAAREIAQPAIDLEAGKRAFIKTLGAGALGAAIFGAAEGDFSAAHAQTINDTNILNFALNLEYLEASFYLFAVTGQGLSASDIGTNPGQVIGGAQVPFAIPTVAAYAMELAIQERSHVEFLRSALGGAAAPRPTIDIGDAFTMAATAAGIISPGQTFNAYANALNFLLPSYIFEDVGVTAYYGASGLIANPAYLTAAAKILAVEAYHAGTIRTTLFAMQNQQVVNDTSAISGLRSSLANSGNPNVDDYSIGTTSSPHIVLGNSQSIAFPRTTRQVLNIVYGSVNAAGGLFFPNGMNGVIR